MSHYSLSGLKYRVIYLCCLSGLYMLSVPLWAAEDAEFDPSFLSRTPGSSVIDVRRFTHGNPVPSGNYYSDIYL